MTRTLTNTRSSGEFEVLRALYRARAHDGNTVTPARLRRYFPAKTSVTQVTSILNGISGTYVTSGSGRYGLTSAGVARTRSNPPHSRIAVY